MAGTSDPKTLQISPTVMDGVTFQDADNARRNLRTGYCRYLPINNLDDVIQKVNSMPHPLALYFFTTEQSQPPKRSLPAAALAADVSTIPSSILATSEMSFGGFGESGMGGYHGKEGFCTFSHFKSIVEKKTWLDLPMRYQPYKKLNNKLIHFFLK